VLLGSAIPPHGAEFSMVRDRMPARGLAALRDEETGRGGFQLPA